MSDPLEEFVDLIVETLDVPMPLFEAEVATDPHASPDTAKAIQAGATAAGRAAGLEAKAAGLDRNGVRFAVSQAIKNHTENWRRFRTDNPVPQPKPGTDDEHVKRVDQLEKTVQKLQADKALDAQKARIEMAKMKADARIEIVRMRTSQRVKSMVAKRVGKKH